MLKMSQEVGWLLRKSGYCSGRPAAFEQIENHPTVTKIATKLRLACADFTSSVIQTVLLILETNGEL